MTDKKKSTKVKSDFLVWTKAPHNITFGADMMEALIRIDDDHTLMLYAEAEIVYLVAAALKKALAPAKLERAA